MDLRMGGWMDGWIDGYMQTNDRVREGLAQELFYLPSAETVFMSFMSSTGLAECDKTLG